MNKNVIKCPGCGREYLPGEIFLPKYFLGQPKDIVRTQKGEIIDFDGIEQDLSEKFTCEECDTPFYVDAKIQYNVQENEKLNFNKPFESKIPEKEIFNLFEQ